MQRQGVLAQQIKTWVICLLHMGGPHMWPWKCSATTLTEVGSWDKIRGALQQPHRCLSAPLIGNVPPPLTTCLPVPHHCQNDPSLTWIALGCLVKSKKNCSHSGEHPPAPHTGIYGDMGGRPGHPTTRRPACTTEELFCLSQQKHERDTETQMGNTSLFLLRSSV